MFSSDGSRLYISYLNEFNFDAVEIREVELTTDYDLTTASFTGKTLDITSIFIDGGNSPPTWLLLENSDTKLYVNEDLSPNRIYQFTFGTDTINEFSLSTGSFASSDVGKQIEGNGGVAVLLDTAGSFQEITAFNDNSTIPAGEWGMFALKFNPQKGIKLAGIIQSAGIDNAVYDTVLFSDTNNINNLGRFRFNATGTRLFVGDIGFQQIAQYDLSTPFDISTASFSTAPQTTIDPESFAFSSDGLVITVMSSNQLQVFSLPTAFDLSGFDFLNATTTFQANLSFGAADVSYNSTGTRLFITRSNVIQQYDLPAAFDVNDLGIPFELSLDPNDTAVSTVFVDGGRRLFVAGNRVDPNTGQQPSIVFEISLAVPFDLTTASFSPNTFTPTEFSTVNAIQFNNDLTKMFLTGDSQAIYQYSAGILAFVQPLDQYSPAVTNAGGQIDTTTWLDINVMAPDELPQAGEVYYAVSTDGRTEWKVIDDADGERIIARDNAGTWEYNSATTYTTDTFTAATTNQELYALQEALAITANRMDKAQLEAVAGANHYALGDSLDLMIALYQATGAPNTPSSDGVAIDYDAETLNQGAVHGIDYDWDFPDSTTVRVTSNAAQNLKIRIL